MSAFSMNNFDEHKITAVETRECFKECDQIYDLQLRLYCVVVAKNGA